MVDIRSESIMITGKSISRFINLVSALFMCLAGFGALISVLISITAIEIEKLIFILIFMAIWLTVVLILLSKCIKEYTKTVTIDENGIQSKNLFSEQFISWSDVKDYGLSGFDMTRRDGLAYCLYFSKQQLKMIDKYRKEIVSDDIINIKIYGDDYYLVLNKVLPFCRQFTQFDYFETQR